MIFQQILKNDVCFKLALFHNIFYFFMIWKLLLKTFISVSRFFFIMKTTFSIFQGMFQNPATVKYYFLKQIKYIMKYQLYMNASKNNRWQLFVISQWFVWNWVDYFTIRVKCCCNFLNLYGRYVLQYKSFLTIFFS